MTIDYQHNPDFDSAAHDSGSFLASVPADDGRVLSVPEATSVALAMRLAMKLSATAGIWRVTEHALRMENLEAVDTRDLNSRWRAYVALVGDSLRPLRTFLAQSSETIDDMNEAMLGEMDGHLVQRLSLSRGMILRTDSFDKSEVINQFARGTRELGRVMKKLPTVLQTHGDAALWTAVEIDSVADAHIIQKVSSAAGKLAAAMTQPKDTPDFFVRTQQAFVYGFAGAVFFPAETYAARKAICNSLGAAEIETRGAPPWNAINSMLGILSRSGTDLPIVALQATGN